MITNQLAIANDYETAKNYYITLEQIEKIIDKEQVKLPDIFYPYAWCESRFLHSYKGKITTSPKNAVGILQIHHPAWYNKARSMNLDIYDKSNNIQFAVWLYGEQRFAPWSSSQNCVDNLWLR